MTVYCPACGWRMDELLVRLGEPYHPCCTPGVDCRTTHELQATATKIYQGALRRGELLAAATCEMCGVPPRAGQSLHGHHDSYRRPLTVRWVCAACHNRIHRRRGDRHP